MIGADSANQEFDGLIDELIMWDSALTSAEVTALYNSGSSLYPLIDSGDYVSSSNVVAFYGFDGNKGASADAIDASGNDFTGTRISTFIGTQGENAEIANTDY